MTTGNTAYPPYDPFIPEKDLCKQFRCSVFTLRRKRQSGVIPPHTYAAFGKTVIYRRDCIAEIFDAIALEGIA